jgi:hypothetical protein
MHASITRPDPELNMTTAGPVSIGKARQPG